jgi:hypothetical protein
MIINNKDNQSIRILIRNLDIGISPTTQLLLNITRDVGCNATHRTLQLLEYVDTRGSRGGCGCRDCLILLLWDYWWLCCDARDDILCCLGVFGGWGAVRFEVLWDYLLLMCLFKIYDDSPLMRTSS